MRRGRARGRAAVAQVAGAPGAADRRRDQPDAERWHGKDPAVTAIVWRQFNTISPENLLRWESIHPEPDRYAFAPADRYVELGKKNGMFVVGHVLLWHQQTPAWVKAGEGGKELDRETALARLKAHVETVVGRYRGRIGG